MSAVPVRRPLALATALALTMPALMVPGMLAADAAAQPAPAGSLDWVAAWLGANDRNANLVEDEAEAVAANAASGAEPVGVLVTFDHAPGDADRAALADLGAGDMYTFTAIPTVNTVVPASRVADLGALGGVAAVAWDRPMHANLDASAPATQANRPVGGPGPYDGFTAEDLGYTGEGVVVAVADTGVNEFHEAFEPLGTKYIGGADSTAVAPPTCGVQADEALHGSHVASTAVGNPAGKPFRGTAFAANLFEMKIGSAVSLGGIDRAFQFILDYNAAIDAGAPKCPLATKKIDVVTLSFGSHSRGGPNAGTTEGLVTALVSRGVVVTIAAGNCGPQGDGTLCSTLDDESIIDSPGNAAGALTIANADDRNTVTRADDTLDASSSRGPNSATTSDGDPTGAEGATSAATLKDRHRKPDVSAPGTDITAALGLTPTEYISLSGTSMATPHVAGIAALLLEAGEKAKAQTGGVNRMRPTGTGFSGAGAYLEGVHPVRDAILHSAEYKTVGVPALMLAKWEGPGADGLQWNNGHGYGHVNAFGALCWAWQNVLAPAGATPPATVTAKCFTVPPLAASAGGPYSGYQGLPIPLSGGATGGSPPYSFAWDLDNDGAFDDATGSLASVTFPTLGTFPLALRATDSLGSVATATTTALVKALAPEALVGDWTFDSADALCDNTEGWYDAVGFDANRQLIPGTPWHLTTNAPASGNCAWYNGLEGARLYLDSTARNLNSPCFTVPPNAGGARLTFKMAGVAEDTFDFLLVRVITGGCLTPTGGVVPLAEGTGAPTQVAAYTGAAGNLAAVPPVYVTRDLDLTPYLKPGDTLQIGFRFESDILIEEQGYQLDDIQLRVRDTAPVLAPVGDQALAEDQVLNLDLGATDADGDPVTFAASGLPEGATLDSDTGALAWAPTHAQVGAHVVTLSASDGLLSDSETITIVVSNLPPTAAGSADRTTTDRLTAVQFADASTDAHGGTIASVAWDFGDGATSAERDPSHTFAALGTFSVSLTATDDHGATDASPIADITVVNLPPLASFTRTAGDANRIAPVQFTDGSSDADGSIVSWLWDFGDGATSAEQSPTHTYAALGDFSVTLTVTDSDGDAASASDVITVVNLLPAPDFATDPAHPITFAPVAFDDLSADPDGTVVAWAWDFGNGLGSTLQDPVTVYTEGGFYNIVLTATDNDGGERTLERSIFVCDPGAELTGLGDADPTHLHVELRACITLNLGELLASAPVALPEAPPQPQLPEHVP